MSRSKIAFYNALSTMLLYLTTIACGFIVPRVLLLAYGSEINGLVTSITQFISYFNLVEAGLASAAVCSLYKPLAHRDHDATNAILSASRIFYNKSGYIFTMLVLSLSVLYPFLVQNSSLGFFEISVLVLLIGITGALEFFIMAKYRVLLTADQKTYIISIASFFSVILNTLITVTLALSGHSIILVRTATLSALLLRPFILYFYVKYRYDFINYTSPPDNQALKKRWDAFYLHILGSVHTAVPIIIATIFTSLKIVSVYSIFSLPIMGATGLLSVVTNGLFASFGDVIARNETATLQNAYEEFELFYYAVITVVYASLAVLIMPFILLYTRGITDINYNLPLVGFLFVLRGLAYNMKTPQGMLVISAGLFRETRIQTTIQAVLAVFFELLFVQFWGLPGILLGAIISNAYRTIDLLFFIPKHVTKLPVRNSFYRMMRIFLASIIIIFPFAILKPEVNSYFEWLRYALFVFIYACTVVAGTNFLLDKTLTLRMLTRLTRLLGKR